MKKVRFVAPARREFLKEVVYYNTKEPGLGYAFAHEIEEAAVRALAFPNAGTRATRNTMRLIVNRFPFSVIYRPDNEGIVIFAIAHHARRPGYWASRA